MKQEDKKPTRYYSDLQESYVSKLLGGSKNPNSGAGKFLKGDIIVKDAGLCLECKTVTAEKTSFSVKKDWLDKHREEAKSMGYYNTALAISFIPDGNENYFVIDEKLMKFLVEKLKEDQD